MSTTCIYAAYASTFTVDYCTSANAMWCIVDRHCKEIVAFSNSVANTNEITSTHAAEFLAQLPDIPNIYLTSNGLKSVGDLRSTNKTGVLHNVLSLYIEGSRSLTLDPATRFPDSLTSLTLENNGLTSVTMGDVHFPTSLTGLSLAANALTHLSSAFTWPPALSTLWLNGNTALDLTSFPPLPHSVTQLHLSNSGITTLPRSFLWPALLWRLSLDANPALDLSQAILPPSITTLDLSNCDFTSLAYVSWPNKLNALSLYGNTKLDLTSLVLPDTVTQLSLGNINLVGNQLPSLFPWPQNLQILTLQENEAFVPTTWNTLPVSTIQQLDMGHTGVTTLRNVSFAQATALKFAGSPVSVISLVSFATGLQSFDCGGCNLTEFTLDVMAFGVLEAVSPHNLVIGSTPTQVPCNYANAEHKMLHNTYAVCVVSTKFLHTTTTIHTHKEHPWTKIAFIVLKVLVGLLVSLLLLAIVIRHYQNRLEQATVEKSLPYAVAVGATPTFKMLATPPVSPALGFNKLNDSPLQSAV